MIVVIASQNEDKIREIKNITEGLGFELVSRLEAGIPDFEIEENGKTFEENSEKKAGIISGYAEKPAIADDSGLEVDYLNGEPGVYSARYAGVEGLGSDKENNKKLLKLLEGVPAEKRTARFVSVISFVDGLGEMVLARGECEGRIAFAERGEGGFGYDPLFIPEGYDKTFAELSPEEKDAISHRGKALEVLKDKLSKYENDK